MKKLRIILFCSLLLITLLYFVYNISINHKSIYNNETNFNGVIEDYKIDGNQLKIYFKDKENLIGIYYMQSELERDYFEQNIFYGSYIKVGGILTNPSNNTIPNTFNYKKYLYNKRIYKIININNIEIDNNNISLFYKIKNKINKQIINNNNANYLKTFILGDKSLIDNSIYKEYQKLGITHLFAISGMHISLFISILLFLLKKIINNENVSYIIIIFILGFYSLLVSFSPSIRRAYIFFVLITLNKIFNLKINNIYLLIICICINLLINPFIIFDIGFLYSITTTFGLLISVKFINKSNYFLKLLKVSIIAYLFSLPITINNFYEINLLTPLNNLIIVPLISLIIYPLSIITFFIDNPIFSILISVFNYINNLLLKTNIFNIITPKMNYILIICYYSIIILGIIKNKKILIIVFFLLIINNYINKSNSNDVYFFNVGQGDSILLITPYQKEVILIDTGGLIKYAKDEWKQMNTSYTLLDNTIIFLKSKGIKQIDSLIITHGDYDHMGEAINLVNNFKVEKVIFNCGEYNDLEKELIKVLDKKNIKYHSCIKELNIDNNKLYFLQTKEYDNENDNSNVIYTEINGYKYMFMGDASTTTEHEILNEYNIPNIDVLKVGHHGSKTSSSKEFIDEINPKYSIISVGKNNRYGHPNKEVLNILDKSKIYRTDQDGSIMFKIKNNKLKIETCNP